MTEEHTAVAEAAPKKSTGPLIGAAIAGLVFGAIIGGIAGSSMSGAPAAKASLAEAEAKLAAVSKQRDEFSATASAAQAKLDVLDKAIASSAADMGTAPAPQPVATSGTISEGKYLVGTDMPAGRYKGTPTDGEEAYWAVLKDANGNKIIANGNESGSFYFEVKKGQFLELSRATATKQ